MFFVVVKTTQTFFDALLDSNSHYDIQRNSSNYSDPCRNDDLIAIILEGLNNYTVGSR